MSKSKAEVTVPTDQPPSHALDVDDIELADGDGADPGRTVAPHETLLLVVDVVGVR